MASTLKINNIEPASGTGITLNPTTTVINGTTLTVNATTTTLPTGKKLVVTDSGGVVAPDMVVQAVTTNGNQSQSSSASGSWVASPIPAQSITTKFANSKILINFTAGVWRTATNQYLGLRIKGGPTGSATTVRGQWGDLYNPVASGDICWEVPLNCTYTAGAAGQYDHTFEIYPNGGGTWFPNNGSGGGSPTHRWTCTLWEIAQ